MSGVVLVRYAHLPCAYTACGWLSANSESFSISSHHTFAFSFTKFAINSGFPTGEPSTGRPSVVMFTLDSPNMEVAVRALFSFVMSQVLFVLTL